MVKIIKSGLTQISKMVELPCIRQPVIIGIHESGPGGPHMIKRRGDQCPALVAADHKPHIQFSCERHGLTPDRSPRRPGCGNISTHEISASHQPDPIWSLKRPAR